MPDEELAKELEEFESALTADDDGAEEEAPVVDETSQEAESEEPEEVTAEEPEEETPDQTEDEKPILTTLPEDEVFGELAGKRVTADQLIEAGLLDKLVTWGHQGRHLIKKGQDEIEAAKAEKSEAGKLRELLEQQFAKENESAQPKISEEEFAAKLATDYLPGLKSIAEQGGIEKDFIDDFPKAAVQLEHRFQSGAQLLEGLIKEVSEIREFVGKQKESNEETAAERARSTATHTFTSLMDNLSSKGELFEKLGDESARGDFVTWLADEENGMRVADKDISDISEADVQAAWLLYAHKNPSVFASKKKKESDAKLAGGGGGKGSAKSRSAPPLDEIAEFAKEYNQSLSEQEY